MSDFAKDTNVPTSDCISRQAALDAFWKLDIEMRPSAIKAITDILEQLPSAKQWTSCSERLPEQADGEYWVCTDTGYQCQCRWTDDVYGLGSSGEWTWKIFDIPQFSHVVAWMPLPEPYKEHSMEEFMQGQDLGDPEDGRL